MSAHATAHAVEAPAMRDRILDAADRLFYAHGIQSIGVDAVVLEAASANARCTSTSVRASC